MAERQATIASSSGLHARPAKLFVAAVQEKGIPVTIAAEGGADLNAGSHHLLSGFRSADHHRWAAGATTDADRDDDRAWRGHRRPQSRRHGPTRAYP